jgi:uncharacterized protein (TIGR02145 family)
VRHMCLQYCDGRTRKDKEGVGCWPRTGVTMNCTGKPANAEYNTPFSVQSSWDDVAGKRLPSSTAIYSENSNGGCSFKCKTDYERKDGSCVLKDMLEWASGPRATCETEYFEIGWYKVAKCNVGATQVWSTSESTTDTRYSSHGCHFQWGNSYCFRADLATNQIVINSNQVNASAYGPSTYSSGTFIDLTQRDSADNRNLWWGIGDTATANGTGSNADRQWPCPDGWHVPSTLEWKGLVSARFTTKGLTCNVWAGSQCSWGGSATLAAFQSELMLPRAGSRGYTAVVYNQGITGYYWSSSPHSSASNAHFMSFNSSLVYPQYNNYRGFGFTIRCFKN